MKMTVVTEVVITPNTLTPLQPTTLRAAIRNSCDVFFTYCGCLVRCETDLVTFLVNFDQNNAIRLV
jgi:hypothetical protein